jgi:hypothetical protein
MSKVVIYLLGFNPRKGNWRRVKLASPHTPKHAGYPPPGGVKKNLTNKIDIKIKIINICEIQVKLIETHLTIVENIITVGWVAPFLRDRHGSARGSLWPPELVEFHFSILMCH